VEDLVDGQHARLKPALYAVKYINAEATLLLETHLNDVPQRQKSSGAARI
jgi:hypothetical protein